MYKLSIKVEVQHGIATDNVADDAVAEPAWPEYDRAREVSVQVSIGPDIGPFQPGSFRHRLPARTADRAPRLGFTRFLAGNRLLRAPLYTQGVGGSSPSAPTR